MDKTLDKKRVVIITAVVFSGISTLIFEVLWNMGLSVVLGGSTYAVSTILSAFMAGLALGAYLGGWISKKDEELSFYYSCILIGFSLTAFTTIPLMFKSSAYYYWLYIKFSFSPFALVTAEYITSFTFMLLPCVLLGSIIPISMKMYTKEAERIGKDAGMLYSINTFGSVVGALLAGFLLINLTGLKGAALAGSFLTLLAGILVVFVYPINDKKQYLFIFVLLFLSFGSLFIESEGTTYMFSFTKAERYTDWANFKEEETSSDLLFYRESATGIVSVFQKIDGVKHLDINGRTEGGTGLDMPNQVLLAALPKAYRSDAGSFLNIGLGTGTTLKTASNNNSYKSIDCVEINRDVGEAVKEAFYKDVFKDERIDFYYVDARNFLLLQDRQYDIISSEPSYPTESGVSHLFTVEFMQIAKDHLSKGGIYCQWLPFYLFTRKEVDIFAKTVGSVFSYVNIWQVTSSGDLLFIASMEPLLETEEAIKSNLKEAVEKFELEVEDIASLRRDSGQVKEIVMDKNIPINTDDRPLLEYAAIKHRFSGVRQRERWDPDYQKEAGE